MKKTAQGLSFALVTCTVMTFLGCEGTPAPKAGETEKAKLTQQIEQLGEQKAQLQRQLDKALAENEQLKGQVEHLMSLGGDKRTESLYRVESVNLSKFTGLFDEDNDGKKEKLVVYVQPIDETGDSIKAAGSAEVELWDLPRPGVAGLVAKWSVEPNEMKKLWLDTIMASGYRLAFDMPKDFPPTGRTLVVKVRFTDYLSGKVFSAEAFINKQ